MTCLHVDDNLINKINLGMDFNGIGIKKSYVLFRLFGRGSEGMGSGQALGPT
jgi:hypothetical protein